MRARVRVCVPCAQLSELPEKRRQRVLLYLEPSAAAELHAIERQVNNVTVGNRLTVVNHLWWVTV